MQDSPFQQTLARSVEITGIGLHGAMPVHVILRPRATGDGIVFRRLDLERELRSAGRRDRVEIPAIVENVCQVDHATTIAAHTPAGRACVQTVEHLLSALHGLGIDACLVEIDAGEVPILDGSAAPWVNLVRSAGVRRLPRARRVRRLLESFAVESGDSSIIAYPSDSLRLTCAIDFTHPAIGRQERSFTLSPESFEEQVAPARTFGFLREVEALQAKGLVKGGSFDNAVVLDDEGVVNGSLRFADEFVRHKTLDLLGDLALGGMPLRAHVVARRAGHRLHVEFLGKLLQNTQAWVVETLSPAIPPPLVAVAPAAARLMPAALAE
jgi:UDP-3-O-[3-hydroxymyristoyl] N-acetylglucosamine deacetylase